MSIRFTEYMLPHGRQRPVKIERPEEIEAMAEDLADAGYAFEAEVLTTGEMSLTVADPEAEEDIAIVLVANASDLPAAVDELVRDAHRKWMNL